MNAQKILMLHGLKYIFKNCVSLRLQPTAYWWRIAAVASCKDHKVILGLAVYQWSTVYVYFSGFACGIKQSNNNNNTERQTWTHLCSVTVPDNSHHFYDAAIIVTMESKKNKQTNNPSSFGVQH